MQNKYLKNQPLNSATDSILDSRTWKFLTESRGNALRHMPKNMHTDSWEWKGNSRGEFSFSNCWDLMRIKYPEWPFYSITWFLNHCPKLSVCLVRAIQGKLLTRHFLKNLGITQDNYCVLCLGSVETIDHLYFQCPFSAYLWRLSRLKLGITSATGSLLDEVTLISNQFKQRNNTSILAKLVFSSVVWHIWKERNARIFQKESKHKIQVFRDMYLHTSCNDQVS